MHKMHMAGGEVFKFATRVIGESIKEAVQIAGIRVTDLQLIVPHQANERIIQAAARSLDLERAIFMSNVEKYGNTSAASIPIALVEAIEQGRVKEGDYLALVGFGGGLAWAAMVLQWSGPKPENRFGAQRRKASYIFAFWRTRVLRFFRRYAELFKRVRPRRGRLLRLRRRLDERLDELK
jgi:hypothetical protein